MSVPASWNESTLCDIADTASGGTPSRSRPSYYGGPIPWVKSGELGDSIVTATGETITQAALSNSSAKIFPRGTLCIALYGATVGRLAILDIDAATNQAVCGIFPGPGISPKYLFYFFQLKRPELIALSQGGAQPNISQAIVRSVTIPIAPVAEQDRIVAEIEKQFTRLDDAVEALKRAQANLKRYRASVLKAACEGRLVPTEAELARKDGRSYEPASELLTRILAQRRAKWEADQLQKMIAAGKPPTDDDWKKRYKEPATVEPEDLPEIPEGWIWTSLDTLAHIVGGITKGQKRNPDDTLRTVPYLRVANVQRGRLDLGAVKSIAATEQEIDELTLVPGDVLLNEGGDRDKLGRGWIWEGQIAECIHQNHVFRARMVSDRVHPKFVSWYANSYGQRYFFEEGKQTTNLASLNMTKLKGLPVPLPPWDDQARIVQELERQLSDTNSLEDATQKCLGRALVLRQTVLRNAFSGKLAPQDPNDEPASVLLERIRAERAAASTNKNGNRKATTGPATADTQRRRRVKTLAQRVSAGKR